MLAIVEKAKGPSDPDVTRPLLGLASVYGSKGEYGEAEGLYKRALAIQEKAKGVSHPDVAKPLLGLAAVHKFNGQYAEAEGTL